MRRGVVKDDGNPPQNESCRGKVLYADCTKMIYVIGSGPAGIACSFALLNKGLKVTMLDAGIEIEPERSIMIENLRNTLPETWSEDRLSFMKASMSSSLRGVPLKYAFGSDFPYRETEKYVPMQADRFGACPSMAKGGLSTVWGAAILPYREDDLKDWPTGSTDLAPHYEAISSIMPVAAYQDDLEKFFPIYGRDSLAALQLSGQSTGFLSRLAENKKSLNAKGIWFGHSRLAVRSNDIGQKKGCIYCGLCMYGCPLQVIYSSAFSLETLPKDRFTYVGDVVVERVEERPKGVKIIGCSRRTGEKIVYDGSRVYLAAGVLSTTGILLRSLGAYDKDLNLLDSQYFLAPLVRYESATVEDKLNTLSQIFMEILDEKISRYTVHLQLYSFNDLYLKAIRRMLWVGYPLFKSAILKEIGRLFVIQGYLHSNESEKICIRLTKSESGSIFGDMLQVRSGADPRINQTIKRVLSKLTSCRKELRAVPLSPAMTQAPPGRGFHIGGTFPMKDRPEGFESDHLGRPAGFKRVHAVDSTVFPSIPATTITYSAMANAHRIGSGYDRT
jgi:ferredoxin